MATTQFQSTRRSGAASVYATKDSVAVSAVNAPAQAAMFERHVQGIRETFGKDGVQPKRARDENGKLIRNENGDILVAKDDGGNTIYEPKHVQAYSGVQSFSLEELDPDDPASWEEAQWLGRAWAEDRAPGHPVLVTTEINGRSGCVHNHIIIGAVHPETGKSLDSNVFTPSRMFVAHDRVLAEQGFEQRADLREMAESIDAEMRQRRQAVLDEQQRLLDAGKEGLTPSQLNRRIISAENSVKVGDHIDRSQQISVEQQREDRKQREFQRYELNEQTRAAAADVGVAPPKEKFSEVELQARVRDSLDDRRSVGWTELSEVGRERGVEIKRRGKDVNYGMMLADSNGELQEPARAHRRRGKRLGEGYRVEDVEAALARNKQLAEQKRRPVVVSQPKRVPTRPVMSNDDIDRQLREQKEQTQAGLAAAEERVRKQQEPPAPAEPDVAEQEVEAPEVETTEHQAPASAPEPKESSWSKAKRQQPAQQAPATEKQAEESTEEAKPKPPAKPAEEKRYERGVGMLKVSERHDRVLIAVAQELEDGSAKVDYQLSAEDPAAKARGGLHLAARDGKVLSVKLSPEQYDRLKQAAGENRASVGNREVMGVRGSVQPLRGDKGYTAKTETLKASEQTIGPDVLERQRAAEDKGREERDRKNKFGQQRAKDMDRSRSDDRTPDL